MPETKQFITPAKVTVTGWTIAQTNKLAVDHKIKLTAVGGYTGVKNSVLLCKDLAPCVVRACPPSPKICGATSGSDTCPTVRWPYTAPICKGCKTKPVNTLLSASGFSLVGGSIAVGGDGGTEVSLTPWSSSYAAYANVTTHPSAVLRSDDGQWEVTVDDQILQDPEDNVFKPDLNFRVQYLGLQCKVAGGNLDFTRTGLPIRLGVNADMAAGWMDTLHNATLGSEMAAAPLFYYAIVRAFPPQPIFASQTTVDVSFKILNTSKKLLGGQTDNSKLSAVASFPITSRNPNLYTGVRAGDVIGHASGGTKPPVTNPPCAMGSPFSPLQLGKEFVGYAVPPKFWADPSESPLAEPIDAARFCAFRSLAIALKSGDTKGTSTLWFQPFSDAPRTLAGKGMIAGHATDGNGNEGVFAITTNVAYSVQSSLKKEMGTTTAIGSQMTAKLSVVIKLADGGSVSDLPSDALAIQHNVKPSGGSGSGSGSGSGMPFGGGGGGGNAAPSTFKRIVSDPLVWMIIVVLALAGIIYLFMRRRRPHTATQ